MKFAVASVFAALSTSVLAALEITTPNANAWWVANSVNLVAWTCNDPAAIAQYTLIVYGPGALQSGLPIISLLNNYDCSESLPANGNFAAGANYTIALTNPQNRTDILAISQPFEVKPEGSTYPPSASPSTTPSLTSSVDSSSTTSSAATTTTSKGAAIRMDAAGAVVGGVAFLLGAFLA